MDYCPCDQCNGKLTGAWEDEEDLSWMNYVPMELEVDPYEGICCGCLEELTPDHTMYSCSEPSAWSEYYRIQKLLLDTYSAFGKPLAVFSSVIIEVCNCGFVRPKGGVTYDWIFWTCRTGFEARDKEATCC